MLHTIEFLRWLSIHGNRPGRFKPRALREADFWSLYEEAPGRPLERAPLALCGHASLLLVVTTFRRPEACAELLQRIHAMLEATQPAVTYRLLVLNDKSDADYSASRAQARELFGERLCWLDARARLGKPGFWRAYQTIFFAARALLPEHTLFLQDDCSFAPTLLSRAYALWSETAHDPRRRVLYLFASSDDEWYGRWILSPRRTLCAALRRTQWFDLQAFFVDRAFLELLDYRMVPFHPARWRRRPNVSSGVGWQLTLRLRHRANIYQTYPALVVHGALPSEMNPGARARRPLDNR